MAPAILPIHLCVTYVWQERKIRREIANSNERRRMQSINAGFQSLRTLLPQHEGEKLSKVNIFLHSNPIMLIRDTWCTCNQSMQLFF